VILGPKNPSDFQPPFSCQILRHIHTKAKQAYEASRHTKAYEGIRRTIHPLKRGLGGSTTSYSSLLSLVHGGDFHARHCHHFFSDNFPRPDGFLTDYMANVGVSLQYQMVIFQFTMSILYVYLD
jgi:hypothetical protein